MGIKVFHCDVDGVPIPIISKQARLIVWPGVGAHRGSARSQGQPGFHIG